MSFFDKAFEGDNLVNIAKIFAGYHQGKQANAASNLSADLLGGLINTGKPMPNATPGFNPSSAQMSYGASPMDSPDIGFQAPALDEQKLLELYKIDPQSALKIFEQHQSQVQQHREYQAGIIAEQARAQHNVASVALEMPDPEKRRAFMANQINDFRAQGKDTKRLQQILSEPDDDFQMAELTAFMRGNLEAEKLAQGVLPRTPEEIAQDENADLDRDITQQNADSTRMNAETSQGNLADDQANTKLRAQELNLAWKKLQVEADTKVEEAKSKNWTEETGLRKEFTSITKDFAAINNAYTRIEAADKSAAGDMALVFNFMKMLDPGSTVREGEYANAQNAAGVPDKVKAYWNQLKNGEILSPAQRADFRKQAKNQFVASKTQHKKRENQFKSIAKKNGFNPDNVVFDRNTAVEGKQPAEISGSAGANLGEMNLDELIADTMNQ